jgi:hypothetical protein
MIGNKLSVMLAVINNQPDYDFQPMLPIELSIELDGISGLLPGNCFMTDYIQERYKGKTLFQAVEVSQTLDSTGWKTSIKGQIRVFVTPPAPNVPASVNTTSNAIAGVTTPRLVEGQLD